MKPVAAVVLFLSTLTPAAWADEPAQLKFAFPSPPTSWINTTGIEPFAKQVGEASGGTVEIKIFTGGALANARLVYDRVVNGVADFGYNTLDADVFPRTQVSALPFESYDPVATSVALWHLIEKNVIAEEWQRVKPIAVFGIPGLGLHSVKPINRLEDMVGIKVSTGSRVISDLIYLMGATPITLVSAEIYPALQRGMVQSAATSSLAVVTFRLDEVTRYHLDVPFGITPVAFFMNRETYARLPGKGRAAVDASSGESLARHMGRMGAQQLIEVSAKLSAPPHVASTLEPAEAQRWKQKVTPLIEDWAAKTQDGAKVLAAYRAELVSLRAPTQ